MKTVRAGIIVLAAILAVLAIGLAFVESVDWLVVMALLIGGLGLGQLVVAGLLASKVLEPTAPGWGASPLGQVLLGVSSVCLAVLIWAGHSTPPVVGWSVAVVYFVLNIVGLRVERQAHARRIAS
jgi:hypothetical protein